MLGTSFGSACQGIGLDGPLTQSGALPSTAPAEAEARPGHHVVRAIGTHFIKGSSGGGGWGETVMGEKGQLCEEGSSVGGQLGSDLRGVLKARAEGLASTRENPLLEGKKERSREGGCRMLWVGRRAEEAWVPGRT